MSTRAPRSNGGPRANRQQGNVKAQIAMLKSSLHGHENVLKATNPPPFNRKPYNTITVEEELSSIATATVTLSSINIALRSQLGLLDELTSLTFKVKRVDLWAYDPTLIPSVRGTFYSLVGISSVSTETDVILPLKTVEDIGVQGQSMAVVSYSWPRDQQDMPVTGLGDAAHVPLFKYTMGSQTSVIYARYHLLWCTGDRTSGEEVVYSANSTAPPKKVVF